MLVLWSTTTLDGSLVTRSLVKSSSLKVLSVQAMFDTGLQTVLTNQGRLVAKAVPKVPVNIEQRKLYKFVRKDGWMYFIVIKLAAIKNGIVLDSVVQV